MLLKLKKKNISLILGPLVILALSFFTLSKQDLIISIHDTLEYFMAMDLGFSYPSNLMNFSDGDRNALTQSTEQKLYSIVASTPKILRYKFSNKKNLLFERIDLDVKFIDYQKIMGDRYKAIKNHVLHEPTIVGAKIRYKGNVYKAKIRLKGDLGDHWLSKIRMSFRVKLKGKNTIFGFKKFSIQKPRARQHPDDYIFQSMMRDAGNLASVHKYAHVYVNGADWGIMDIEEHMSKELLEKQKRKESVIVRFSNETKWLYEASGATTYPFYRIADPTLYLKFYNEKKYLKNIYYRKVYSYISKLHSNYNVLLYDTNSFSKAYILATAWGEWHTLYDSNCRYYFNPYTLKLEPITTDQIFYKNIAEQDYGTLPRQYLRVATSVEYSKNLTKNLNEINAVVSNIQNYLDYTHSFFPVDRKKEGKIVVDNMRKIMSETNAYLKSVSVDFLEPSSKNFSLPTHKQASGFKAHLKVNHYTDGQIELINLLPDTVIVDDIIFGGKSLIRGKFPVPSYLASPHPVVIKTKYTGVQDNKYMIKTDYAGFKREVYNEISLIPAGEIKNPLLLGTEKLFSFLKSDDLGNYRIMPGEWDVMKPIIINGDLNIPAGVKLNFSNDAYLIVKGALNIMGKRNKPVTLKSLRDSWKGMYVLNADEMSRLNYVDIKNAVALDDGLLKLTGAITFYKSDVIFNNVKIENIKTEDALNIVESNFKMNAVLINATLSDGLDSDYSEGIISNSTFSNVGGDALDFSGSDVTINKVEVTDVKDKAVSAGEGSSIKINNSEFFNVGVGVASKDGSQVIVMDTKISNYSLYAAMTYIKKDYYLLPSLELVNCEVDEGEEFARQSGTSMFVDTVAVPEINLNVSELYKSKVMKK